MTDTLVRGEKFIPAATAGTVVAGPSRAWQNPEIVGAMMHSASDLVTLSGELPNFDLEDRISGKTMAIVGFNLSLAGPSASGEATGRLAGVYATDDAVTIEPSVESAFEEPFRFRTIKTSGISPQPLMALVLGGLPKTMTVLDSVDTSTFGEVFLWPYAGSDPRPPSRHSLSEEQRADDSHQIEADYPNLVRALKSGLLERLVTPPARTPNPVEEPTDVSVERQVSYGRTADPPTHGRQRRPGVSNSLFDD